MNYRAEKRRFKRIIVSLSLKHHGRRQDTGAPFQGQGVLRDISMGGAYFYVNSVTSFHLGQILSIDIFPTLPYLEDIRISHLQANGEVVRIEPPEPQRSEAGIALNFSYSPKIEGILPRTKQRLANEIHQFDDQSHLSCLRKLIHML